jgi:hypothetical protein
MSELDQATKAISEAVRQVREQVDDSNDRTIVVVPVVVVISGQVRIEREA